MGFLGMKIYERCVFVGTEIEKSSNRDIDGKLFNGMKISDDKILQIKEELKEALSKVDLWDEKEFKLWVVLQIY